LDTVDFYTPVGPAGQPSTPEPFRNNDNNHLSAALFHAGKSVTPNDYGVECRRINQVNTGYTVVLGPDGKPITKSIADNTVNEYIDTYNNLHFYILDKIQTPGPYGEDILSYQVGVRHMLGQAVGGTLSVKPKVVEGESWNRVAVVNLEITNNGGSATDIIRVKVNDDLEATVLNNLYAIGIDETITVPVYVAIPSGVTSASLADKSINLTVSSETTPAKVITSTVDAQDVYQRLLLGGGQVASAAKINSDKWGVTISGTGIYEDGTKEVFTKTFTIKHEGNVVSGVYQVGKYFVFAEIKTTQIRACYLVEEGYKVKNDNNQGQNNNSQGGNSQGGNSQGNQNK
jgi:hypothetical protein